VLKIKVLLAAAVVAACSATPLLAQTQPAAPDQQPPAVTQPPAPSPAGAAVSTSPQMPAATPVAQTPPPAPLSPVSDSDRSTAVQLLDRIQQVLDKAAEGKTGDVTIDRGLLDEIRAEVTQVKLTMARPKQ